MPFARSRIPAWTLSGASIATFAAIRFAERQRLGAVDDAYISLRYAANWAGGRGLVFNPGEQVEGYSNFLWVALHALAIRAGGDPEAVMNGLGWLSFFGLAWLTCLLFARHVLPRNPGSATLIGVATVLCPILVCWASSGMETCFYAALVLAALLSALERGPLAPLLGGALLALAALTRLEAAALAPVLVIVVWAAQRSLAACVRFSAVFSVGFGTYFVARALHFGQLFPNTFYAKLDYGSFALLQRGVGYVFDFALGAMPVAILALCGAVLLGRAPLWARACAAVAGVQLGITAWEGGDHLALWRFLAPTWVPLVALAFFAVCEAARRVPEARRPVVVLAVSAMAVVSSDIGLARLPMSGVGLADPRERASQTHKSQLLRFQGEVRLARILSRVGRALGRAVPSGASLSTVAIGAIGFHSDLSIIDPHGLVFSEIARARSPLGDGYPGHEKFDVDLVLSRRPDYLLLHNSPTRAPVASDDLIDEVWGEFNRAALRHPALTRDYEYHSIPYRKGWLNLHLRRGSAVPGPLTNRSSPG